MIRVTQVSQDYVRSHLDEKGLYRICVFDDSKAKQDEAHMNARIKSVSALSVCDIVEDIDTEKYAFIQIV